MSSEQDLRKRIKSVKNTQQITKAMKMVASARLRRAQTKAKNSEPYANRLRTMLSRATQGVSMRELNEPLLEVREINRIAYVVIGADKGLAGAHTSNLIKKCITTFDKTVPFSIVAVGRKPYEYFKGHKYTIESHRGGFSDKPSYSHAKVIVKEIVELFNSKKVDKVVMIYTHFINTLTHEPRAIQLLPITPEDDQAVHEEYFFEPSEEVLFNRMLPIYLESVVYAALLLAAASELGSRMTAMTSATDNAGELITSLNLEYNKLRQAGITNEISEIVGGANALQ